MAQTTGIVFLLCFMALFATRRVSAWSGTVTFYAKEWQDESGGKYTYHIDDSQMCVNLSCYNDRATSAKWNDIVKWGAFDGRSRIAFYTGKDCSGKVVDWDIKYPNGFPIHFGLDGIDKDISSFMIWQHSKEKWSSVTPCPWDFKCCLG